MAIEQIRVPDIGGSDKVEVIEVCVAVGDTVAAETSLIVLESDKASMEVPSPMAGCVVEINLNVGDQAGEGDLILTLETDAVASEAAPVSAPAPSAAPAPVVEAASAAPLATSAAAVSSQQAVHVPDLGGADEVDVIEVCVKVGDQINEGDSMVVLESDKASMEVPAPAAGKVLSIAMSEGSKAKEGDLILTLEVQGQGVAAAPAVASAPAVAASVPAAAAPVSAPSAAPVPVAAPAVPARSGDTYAGPAVRLLAREFGVDLAQVGGSGPKGRILKEDVQAYVKAQLAKRPSGAAVTSGSGIPAIPEVDFSQFGPVDIQPMSKLHRVTAANMQRSWLNVPHVTQFDDVDITELELFRKSMKAEAERAGVKLTPLPFLLKACAAMLKRHPKINSSLHADGESLVYKQYVHIGIAVDTPAGLVVPVIRDVAQKSLFELAAESAELAAKAKDRKLKPAEMQGGCFTISSLGGLGGTGFTPIVNAPEVAILGVSRLQVKPVWDGSSFQPREMLPLSLSYDHRVVNGADAGRFFTDLGACLSEIRRLLL